MPYIDKRVIAFTSNPGGSAVSLAVWSAREICTYTNACVSDKIVRHLNNPHGSAVLLYHRFNTVRHLDLCCDISTA